MVDGHAVDGQNPFAPPCRSLGTMTPPVNTAKEWLQPWFHFVARAGKWSIHSGNLDNALQSLRSIFRLAFKWETPCLATKPWNLNYWGGYTRHVPLHLDLPMTRKTRVLLSNLLLLQNRSSAQLPRFLSVLEDQGWCSWND